MEEQLTQDIEYASHSDDDKVQLTSDVIGGFINVTKIEPSPEKAVPQQEQEPQGRFRRFLPSSKTVTTTRSMWRRRRARSAEEGIRREKASELSSILAKAKASANDYSSAAQRHYAARTLTGLITALADEVDDLDVEVDARRDTPIWGKHVDAVRIKFSRLGFKPLRMGGLDIAMQDYKQRFPTSNDNSTALRSVDRQLLDLSCADEAFDRIDADNSGALDSDEIAEALTQAAVGPTEKLERKNVEFLKRLASELVDLYDFNGDGVVDRTEYQSMVEDMAALQKEQEEEDRKGQEKDQQENASFLASAGTAISSAAGSVGKWFSGFFSREGNNESLTVNGERPFPTSNDTAAVLFADQVNGENRTMETVADAAIAVVADVVNETKDTSQDLFAAAGRKKQKEKGSITFSDVKLDLRRLVFGAVPILKHILPGGPLILEPFTVTIVGSFNRGDIMESVLLDAGLRRLVAQALKRRVRWVRDIMDGAVFSGRKWKITGASAPFVQVLELTNIEFDHQDRLILTGRAQVQPRKEVPMIENSFKLRTKLGTRNDGRFIKLVEPELALVLECPRSWEEKYVNNWNFECVDYLSPLTSFLSSSLFSFGKMADLLGVDRPSRPNPIYSFFPIYSPFKLEDNDGFDLGEDNRIKSIYVKDNALRFEMSAVLRPGRFLGNHYLAFTIPIRTFIITLDRVREGIRAARRNKRATQARLERTRQRRRWRLFSRRSRQQPTHARQPRSSRLGDDLQTVRSSKANPQPQSEQHHRSVSPSRRMVQPKSFFSRFVDGYLQAERDDVDSERVTTAIRDFFGRQGQSQLKRRQERDRIQDQLQQQQQQQPLQSTDYENGTNSTSFDVGAEPGA